MRRIAEWLVDGGQQQLALIPERRQCRPCHNFLQGGVRLITEAGVKRAAVDI